MPNGISPLQGGAIVEVHFYLFISPSKGCLDIFYATFVDFLLMSYLPYSPRHHAREALCKPRHLLPTPTDSRAAFQQSRADLLPVTRLPVHPPAYPLRGREVHRFLQMKEIGFCWVVN
jgi:hypothetical protein